MVILLFCVCFFIFKLDVVECVLIVFFIFSLSRDGMSEWCGFVFIVISNGFICLMFFIVFIVDICSG